MKKPLLMILALAVLLLFLIQSMGTLVESIYILDLMSTGLDAKVLGVLFFFAPLLALPFVKRFPRPSLWILFALVFVSRGLIPYLTTSGRLLAAGIAAAAAFSLLFELLSMYRVDGRLASAGLALTVALSALLRAAGHGVEFSLTPAGGWIGWLLGLALGILLLLSLPQANPARLPAGNVVGLMLVITLVYFSVSAPAVIARWTQGNYTLIAAAVSLLSLVWAWLAVQRPGLAGRISKPALLVWNLLFTLSLTLTLVAQRVSFPPTLNSAPVVVAGPTFLQIIPLGLMLVLFPVLFLDFQRFTGTWQGSGSQAAGILIGAFSIILLVFINIFSNVWGYVKPVSPYFRNTFWLAFFLLSAAITLLAWRTDSTQPASVGAPRPAHAWAWTVLAGVIFIATLGFALPPTYTGADAASKTSLRVMTMNVQGFNDANAQKSFTAQLALIQSVSPDVLALQENDTTRISLNNNDYVRYFADKLGYYSYFGPKTVAGTYGTAILSRFPLENTATIFMYSDKDETGVTRAEVNVGGQVFTIFDVHPDSSDPAMVAFAQNLITLEQEKPNAIALGDYNLRDYEEAYKLIDAAMTNAWTSVYPTKIGDGVDMSGENRIDHIFLSRNLSAVNPTYILPPASATDHPVHWTDVVWGTR